MTDHTTRNRTDDEDSDLPELIGHENVQEYLATESIQQAVRHIDTLEATNA